MSQFGKLLKDYREKSRGPNQPRTLTQAELADILDCDRSVIGHWETGRSKIHSDARPLLVRLIKALHKGGGVQTLKEANHLLRAGNYRSLDSSEIREINVKWLDGDEPHPSESTQPPFLVPGLPPQGVLGRDDDLKEILDLLMLNDTTSKIPPIALWGMGGIGKTTLATALGHSDIIPRHFPDGVLWVSVGPRPTVRVLLDSWGKALDINLFAETSEETCSERLRSALHHRRMLLLVDDLWEVSDGRYFDIGGPNCRIVITTRESPVAYTLATRERAISLNVLKSEDALALLTRIAPDCVNVDPKTTTALCERLEFLPLALTLAGRLLALEADVPSRMQRLIDELIEHHDARLQLIQIEGRDGLEDETPSLEAILGMSVERLEKIDQERFAMASVFGGDPLTWDIDAAANVWECKVEEAEETTSRFIQRGLVTRRGGGPEICYGMHALFADYATEMREKSGL